MSLSSSPPQESLQPRVLIADDERGNQMLFPMFLKRMGIDSKIVSNGAEAVEAAKESEFDLILMDVNMPKMNGFDATVAIRELEKDRKPAYIAALTADNRESTLNACNAAGMNEVVTKPIMFATMEDLIKRVSEMIRTPQP